MEKSILSLKNRTRLLVQKSLKLQDADNNIRFESKSRHFNMTEELPKRCHNPKYFAELTPVPIETQLDDNNTVMTKLIDNTYEDTSLNAGNPSRLTNHLIPTCTPAFEDSHILSTPLNSNKIVENKSVLLNNQSAAFSNSEKNKVIEFQSCVFDGNIHNNDERTECLLLERSTKEVVTQTLNITSQGLNTVGINTLPEEDSEFENLNTSTQSEGRPNHGRKRKYLSQHRAIRKMNFIQNKEYVSQRGKVQEAKEFRQYLCRCNCFDRIRADVLQNEFRKFYSVESHDVQRALLCSMVTETDIKRKRAKSSERRGTTRLYTVAGIRVCKQFFLQTFRVSGTKVQTALEKLRSSDGVRDQRGIGGGANKISNDRIQEIVDHINKFPKYKSHYRRSETDSEFLSPDTTVMKMYELYKQECVNPTSYAFYKHIFLTKFNLKRKRLKKDTCNICDRLENEIKNCTNDENLKKLKLEKSIHLELAEKAQLQKKE